MARQSLLISGPHGACPAGPKRALEAAWQRYKDRDVVFLGVNIQDKEEDARAFLEEFGITYLDGWDSSGKIAIDYGVWGIPETFFLDPQGRITYKHGGGIASFSYYRETG